MNAIGYIRISKKDQSTHSLDYQEKSIKDYCDRNDLELGSLFIDDGESSFTFDRPDYIALENFIKKHKGKVKYLVVFDHDRFSRNLPEALQKIEFLEKKHDLKVISINEPLDIDTSDPSVFLQRAFKYLIANQELMTIRKRAKVSARHAQESGRYFNKAPFAYINAKDSWGKMVIQINEPDRHIVEKVYRDYLNDIPHYIIHQEIKKLGFTQTATSSVFRILNNPLYCGLVKVCAHGKLPEKLVKGIHEAIMPEYLYRRAQDKLKRNKRKMVAKSKEEYPLKGVIKSPCCGRDLTAGWSTGKRKKYLYYRCLDHSNVKFRVLSYMINLMNCYVI
jgi:site-specific DNA recombinase